MLVRIISFHIFVSFYLSFLSLVFFVVFVIVSNALPVKV